MTRRSLYPLAVTAPGWRTVHAGRGNRFHSDRYVTACGRRTDGEPQPVDQPVSCVLCLRFSDRPLRPHERAV